jgi:phage terminase large subunit-like protein
MRQKLITLDPTSWDLAAKKTNFSDWVRNQLRSERNRGGDYGHYVEQLEEEVKELERLKEYWYRAALNYKKAGEEE